MNGDTQIYVSGREFKVPGHVVSYEQVVKIWNELHAAENKHIIGTPGIDYENDLKGEDGVLITLRAQGRGEGVPVAVMMA